MSNIEKVTFDRSARSSSLPPGFGQPEFEANYARAQTWVVFGLAGARKLVLTKVLYGFEPQVVKIIEWMMDQVDVGAGQRPANDN